MVKGWINCLDIFGDGKWEILHVGNLRGEKWRSLVMSM